MLCEVTGPDLIPPRLITQYSQLYLQGGELQVRVNQLARIFPFARSL